MKFYGADSARVDLSVPSALDVITIAVSRELSRAAHDALADPLHHRVRYDTKRVLHHRVMPPIDHSHF